uniref:Uncharacterized protein n=1 Tax=Aegilops tauschii subsp. strangulata TaxID=200361 RepID=A0A453FQ12_AEGTS
MMVQLLRGPEKKKEPEPQRGPTYQPPPLHSPSVTFLENTTKSNPKRKKLSSPSPRIPTDGPRPPPMPHSPRTWPSSEP